MNIVGAVVCTDPGERANARRLEGAGPYLVDSTVTYVCDHGNAIERIFCQSNGQWTTLRSCYGKKLIFSMQLQEGKSWPIDTMLFLKPYFRKERYCTVLSVGGGREAGWGLCILRSNLNNCRIDVDPVRLF